MDGKDYNKYDYLEIIVKKENSEEIITAYSSFLWQKLFEKEDRRYNDVVHLTFKRDINIANKDRLALMQVYYETALNKRAGIKFNKHSKSKIAICNVAVLSVAILFGIGVFFCFLKTFLSIALACVFLLSLFVLDIFISNKIKKVFIKENKDYVIKLELVDNEIKQILQKVSALTKDLKLNDDERGSV